MPRATPPDPADVAALAALDTALPVLRAAARAARQAGPSAAALTAARLLRTAERDYVRLYLRVHPDQRARRTLRDWLVEWAPWLWPRA